MSTPSQITRSQSKEDGLKNRDWFLIDAAGVPLGRLASEVAELLRGKHKPTYTPHTDGGDYVVILNAEQIKLTGKKLQTKLYHDHSTFIGGLKIHTAEEILERNPERVVTQAIKGMLPKGPLGRSMATKLKVYSGSEHEHAAQMPKPYKLRHAKKAVS